MGEGSKIQWCHHTMNPWIGCSKVSAGCANCYAEVNRFVTIQRGKGRELWGPNGTRHVTSSAYWRQPLAWDREAAAAGERRRVFCASLADVFEDREDLVAPRGRLWALVRDTPHLDWLLLTKRPENASRLWNDAQIDAFNGADSFGTTWGPNVWLGTTVEDRKALGRLDELRRVPAAVLFASFEPLLEDLGDVVLTGIHWGIVGGEGNGGRPCDLAWARSLIRQMRAAGIATFVKQLGSNAVLSPGPLTFATTDPKGGDIDEFPEDLRVREFPEVRA